MGITAFIQDVHDGPYILRYSTNHPSNSNYPAGNMSVYQVIGSEIFVDSEKSIVSNEAGEPQSITGVQRYFPRKLLGPTVIPIGPTTWNRTTGQYGWCPGDCYPAQPIPGTSYIYDSALHTNGSTLWWDEHYTQDGIFYPKGFNHNVSQSGQTLVSFTDAGRTHYRFSGVYSDGVCWGGPF